MDIRVKDNGMVIGKHSPKTFEEFQEIAFLYKEKFK
jgi:hypothetical protein